MHMHSSAHKNQKQLRWVLLLSASYMVAEIVGGILSHSLALLADAGHMAIDVAAIVLSLFAIWISQKPPTHEKTYGYYRVEILAALMNGATLVALSIWLFVEAARRFSDPPEVHGAFMTVIATGGVVVNIIALLLTHRGKDESLNIHGVWLHLVSDTLGSVSAIIAGLLVWKLGWNLADPIISMIISVLILFGSWRLLSDCVNVLLEGCPKGLDVSIIRLSIESIKSISEVHDLHVWTVTSGVNALSAHVRLSDDVEHGPVLEAITKMLHDRFHIEHVTLQLEPPAFSHREMHF